MATIYAPTLRTARLAAVVTAIGATGYLVIGTAALDGSVSSTIGVLVKIPLDNPAGVVTGDVLAISQPVTATATADGTAEMAEIWDTNTPTTVANVIVSGLTVGTTSSSNVVLGTVDIRTGGVVAISPATITHATT